jgi:hypothetical protein
VCRELLRSYALRFNGQVYLFEFKVLELDPEGKALAQIKARGYAD